MGIYNMRTGEVIRSVNVIDNSLVTAPHFSWKSGGLTMTQLHPAHVTVLKPRKQREEILALILTFLKF
jgi:hypothetical protein